jgi:hypothetical protein
LVAVISVASGITHFGTSSGPGTQTRAIMLPEHMGVFEDLSMFDRRYAASVVAGDATMDGHAARLTVTAYERAYPGASAAFDSYTNNNFDYIAGVVAVRAPSPGLTIGEVDDPADAGLSMDLQTVESFGDVSCVILNSALTSAGQPVKPSSLMYTKCQRSGPHLSVFTGGTGFQGNSGRDAIVALTNAAYDAAAES